MANQLPEKTTEPQPARPVEQMPPVEARPETAPVTPPPEVAPAPPERPPAPSEITPEVLPTREAPAPPAKEGFFEEALGGVRKRLKRPKPAIQPPTVPLYKDAVRLAIENIMADGLKEAYQALPVMEQQKFKMKGEETAGKIRDLLKATHVKIKKIFRLLLEWLKMLPGINRFYLEQEAKIKADKIIALKETRQDMK
ncbi:MAG: hypothetical protein A3C90_04665 [Candidatus Magasanikbacteria bacterium RIFCSPHIGHO2_02_FULL_51_14]|uniref:Uncharacterized protein n=1 Tax=Candidatus Magasanikbacteria bacterium RIFCSPHIGHO2_02_FULL_51_14 TaxID=1798683 RepID=A0A1F6MHD2_9BACT|nr:MAG: hypothetical protein A3C90_04665 [Candidatus Magasanikbacteria bacterium RIFCSPHIGHO2_02_FULL_51_14]